MTLEELLAAGKITGRDIKHYHLFTKGVGREWLSTRWEAENLVLPSSLDSQLLAYHEGRRAIFRELKLFVEKIDSLLTKGEIND